MENKTIVSILQEITTDIFLLKQKLTDQEYLMLLEKFKRVFEKVENDNKTKVKLFTKYNKLQERYIKVAACFTNLYYDTHGVHQDEEEEGIGVSFVSVV